MSLFRINTNVSALNAQRQLDNGNQQLAEAQERLSSGLRINSAADDAAGLAISQKTTAQIKGLNQASTNAQDGISMIQTAEGGLSETQSSLQRMRELSVQASNDTLTGSDREQIQGEVDALAEEIQRISDQTEFNTKSLLDGSLESGGDLGTQQLQVGANEGQTIEFNVSDMGTGEDALNVNSDEADSSFATPDAEITKKGATKDATTTGSYEIVDSGGTGSLQIADSGGNVVATSKDGKTFTGVNSDGGAKFGDDEVTFEQSVETGQAFGIDSGGNFEQFTGASNKLESGEYSVKSSGVVQDQRGERVGTVQASTGKLVSGGETLADFGKGAGSYFNDAGTETISVGGPDITTTDDAEEAITTLDNAINAVSSERSELGALQNRLETTISVDDITSENLEAARSRIRDADVAQESVKQTRGNILVQAGTSVLAQANQNPQSALQLLGG